jgi:hypothetical protein
MISKNNYTATQQAIPLKLLHFYPKSPTFTPKLPSMEVKNLFDPKVKQDVSSPEIRPFEFREIL